MVLSSDGAFNNQQTGAGETNVRTERHDEMMEQRQTSMSWDVMTRINKYSQDIDRQLTNRSGTAWTVSLTHTPCRRISASLSMNCALHEATCMLHRGTRQQRRSEWEQHLSLSLSVHNRSLLRQRTHVCNSYNYCHLLLLSVVTESASLLTVTPRSAGSRTTHTLQHAFCSWMPFMLPNQQYQRSEKTTIILLFSDFVHSAFSQSYLSWTRYPNRTSGGRFLHVGCPSYHPITATITK